MKLRASVPGRPSTLPRLRSVEAAKLLEHQMYFWGKDVLHPGGNLLRAYGCDTFARRDAPHPVRCYEVATAHGLATLHSTGVHLHTGGAGVAYLRATHRLYHTSGAEMPLPCPSLRDLPAGLRSLRPSEFPAALTALLAFVSSYESWAAARLPGTARTDAWREFRRTASRGVRWLPPDASLAWLHAALNVHCRVFAGEERDQQMQSYCIGSVDSRSPRGK